MNVVKPETDRCPEAFVLKTVAGHPQQCLNDIAVLDTLAPLENLIIMHHTGESLTLSIIGTLRGLT